MSRGLVPPLVASPTDVLIQSIDNDAPLVANPSRLISFYPIRLPISHLPPPTLLSPFIRSGNKKKITNSIIRILRKLHPLGDLQSLPLPHRCSRPNTLPMMPFSVSSKPNSTCCHIAGPLGSVCPFGILIPCTRTPISRTYSSGVPSSGYPSLASILREEYPPRLNHGPECGRP